MAEVRSPEIEKIETKEIKKSNKTLIFIIAGIVLILLIGGFAYYKVKGTNIINNINIINQNNNVNNQDTKDSSKMTGNTINTDKNPQVLIETSEGNIKLELYPDKAPITVDNFLSYVKEGTYEGTVFHRVIKNFMIQGGGYTSSGEEKPTKAPIKLESDNGLKNEAGTIAMARTMVPDSATDQFFINTVNNDFLNYAPNNPGYAVFGKVIDGMDVVKKIEALATASKFGMEDWPVKDIVIKRVSVVG